MSFEVHNADCLDHMRTMPDNAVDAVVTDPPYGLTFMGKDWDKGVPGEVFWREALRVAKPGAHLLAFGGTRTFHRLTCAIEDAGWEIRDCIMWVYSQGFPKSLDVSKAIDKAAGAEREVVGSKTVSDKRGGNYHGASDQRPAIQVDITAPATDLARKYYGFGTCLKPAFEPIILARKPLDGTVASTVAKWGTGGLNVDGCRVEGKLDGNPHRFSKTDGGSFASFSKSPPVVRSEGRFPANLVHDGSEEVLAGFPVTGAAKATPRHNNQSKTSGAENGASCYGSFKDHVTHGYDDLGGSAARFFYCAPSDKVDLLFHRAKCIMSAWRLTQGEAECSLKSASVADVSLCQQKSPAAFALSDAVTVASLGAMRLSDARGLSMTETERELETLCETLITAMLISESDALPAQQQDVQIPNGCLVRFAETQKRTGTTMITISRPKSGGFAESVTFYVTPNSTGHGAAGSATNRFRYCAKASRGEREAGLDRTCSVKYNIDRQHIGGLSCKDAATVLVQSLRRVTSGLTTRWNTGESGESIMGLCPLDSLYTTLTEISRITTSEILNSLPPLSTSESIAGASCGTASGGSLAENAENSSPLSPATTSAETGLAHGVSLAASEMLLTISEGANWKPMRNVHSTVKPIALMRWLVRLVTPPDGLVLDPFTGSGTTGCAAVLEGKRFIGCELSAEYAEIARARLAHHAAQGVLELEAAP